MKSYGYNDGMEKEFARRADVDRILKVRNNHLIKVVTGLRKVGKS